jgi:hypothetical protein
MFYNESVLTEEIKSNASIFDKKKQRVAILQIEDRNEEYFEWCMKINKAYCDKHNIDHILLRKGPDNISPYWYKVFVFLDLMKRNKHDIICWMDSDAYIHDFKYDLRNFFQKGSQTMVISPDPPGMGGSSFMAAVYMIKNDAQGRQIFEDWIKYYNPRKWAKINGKIKYIGHGTWAGIDYEQGSFAKYILPKYKHVIKTVPWYVFHEINCTEPHQDCWAIHIPGHLRQTRQACVLREKMNNQMKQMNTLVFVITLLLIVIIVFLALMMMLLRPERL